MQTNKNRIFLRGRLAAPPVPSHTNHGVQYYTLPLTVRRLSGAEDRLNVVASQEQLARLWRRETPCPSRGRYAPSTTAAASAAVWWSASLPGS
jgi:hypothetical protein